MDIKYNNTILYRANRAKEGQRPECTVYYETAIFEQI